MLIASQERAVARRVRGCLASMSVDDIRYIRRTVLISYSYPTNTRAGLAKEHNDTDESFAEMLHRHDLHEYTL